MVSIIKIMISTTAETLIIALTFCCKLIVFYFVRYHLLLLQRYKNKNNNVAPMFNYAYQNGSLIALQRVFKYHTSSLTVHHHVISLLHDLL